MVERITVHIIDDDENRRAAMARLAPVLEAGNASLRLGAKNAVPNQEKSTDHDIRG